MWPSNEEVGRSKRLDKSDVCYLGVNTAETLKWWLFWGVCEKWGMTVEMIAICQSQHQMPREWSTNVSSQGPTDPVSLIVTHHARWSVRLTS